MNYNNDNAVAELLAHGRAQVSVVMGHATLSFDQLARLGPGSIVELGRTPAPRAALYLGNTCIADVELVDRDGELAAQIISLRHQLAQASDAGGVA